MKRIQDSSLSCGFRNLLDAVVNIETTFITLETSGKSNL
jgi:hypothetical protein